MSTTSSSQEEPITCESVLRFVKQQTEAFSRALAEQGVEFDRRIAEERRMLEEESERRKKYMAEEAERRKKYAAEEAERRKEYAAEEAERRKEEAEHRKEESKHHKEEMERHREEAKRHKEEMERLEESEAKWKAEHKRIRSEIGGIGKSNGEYAEQFFIRAMKRTQTLAGIKFNRLEANYNVHGNGIDEEYDIVLYNGEYIAIIEIKYKFEKDDLSTFVHRKIPNFRKMYPNYADKKIILGIAGFSFENDIADKARAMGIAVLHKDGKNVEYDDANLKTF